MNSFVINKITRHISFSAQRNANLLPVYLPRLSQLYLSTQATASTSTDENAPEEIILQCKDNIATLTFNRPKKANSIGKQMLAQLHDTISMLSSEQGNDIRCVVLTSCSDKVFSAGADLKERSKMSKEEAASFVTSLRDCMDCLSSLPMPLIASVEGAALGGGLEIALTADIIVSGTNALFGAPETSLAIIPGAGGTQRLPRLIGTARAKELIYTARRINARTAHEFGIVQYLTPSGNSNAKAMRLALEIAQNGPIALRAAKLSIDKGMECTSLSDAMEVEKACYGKVLATKDRLEGLAAFKEKRKPNYQGC